jgi:hypothetical protein
VGNVGALSRILLQKTRVVTRAVFWRIPHKSGEVEVNLKLGRYKRSAVPFVEDVLDVENPKSELTLNTDELNALITFLQENYEPFKQGIKAFIPLEKPFSAENAGELKKLFSVPDKAKLVDFLLDQEIITSDLYLSIEHVKRANAVREFELLLDLHHSEDVWQKWFERNSWVLGSEFVRVLDERRIDVKHITDYLMQAYDGFLDIVEIKKPELGQDFWARTLDHGNYYPSAELTKAITQATNYIFEVERESNSLKFLESVNGVRAVKPRGVLVFGRSIDWNNKQKQAYRLLNCSYHSISVMTYDHVLARAKRMLGIAPSEETALQDFEDDDIPF